MASAIGTALISTILQPMAAKAMNIIKDKGKAIVRSMADKAMDKAMDEVMDMPMDRAMAMVVDKVDGIVNIERDISNLQITLRMIQGIVQVAEEKQIDDDFIDNWLRDLVDISYEARDVLDDFITFSSCIITAEEASNPVNFISSFMLSYFGGSSSDTSNIPLAILNRLQKDIRSVRERFDEKKKEGETFATLKSVMGGISESVKNRRPEVGPFINKQRDALFLGRGEVKQGIMEKIQHPADDNDVHVVAIWGMGGIGKTTLAQSIYNDERVKKVPRSWFCVGENKFSAKKVIREMVDDQNTTGIGKLQEKVVEELRDRFLIVLDDVWDVDRSEWDLLFNPLTNVGKGGLIIITTRRREVCTAINTQTTYDLKHLSEEDSWPIFESFAYVNGKADSTPDLKRTGKEIVKKLNGLPLALKVVGRSLLNKDSSTWTNFLESKLTKDDEVMSALRWSYNHLPRHLKTCFTYFSLFPKGHVFIEKVLVEMWMAHDLIKKEKQTRPEDVGAHYFKQLVNTSLLQSVAGKYVMHDLIHDLALLVSNGEFATANGLLSVDQMEEVRHITLTHCDYSKIPRLCKIEKLLTLYTIRSSDSVLDDVFKQLKSIRVLVLSFLYEIKEIPNCISELKHLRYLDVSETGVESLPDSLCHLYNLQMLAAPLDAVLPIDIVNMVNLRYVRANLSACKGVGKLTSLQELSSIHVCKDENIRELGDMQLLHGTLTIKGLENVTSSEDALGASMEKQAHIDRLILLFDKENSGNTTISEKVLDALGCPLNLTYLRIAGYNGLKPPKWIEDGKHKFDKLQTVELSHCLKLESLPPLGELNFLRDLSLQNLHGVKRLGNEFHGNLTKRNVFFPTLESLHFSVMFRLEEWNDIIIENSSVSFFPRLTRLEIRECAKLVSVLPVVKNFMTSLSRLEIRDCDRLERLQLDTLVSLKDLDIRRCKSLVHITSGICLATTIERLEIFDCDLLETMDFERLPSLKHLDVSDCHKLISIPCLVGLKFLELSGCQSLRSLSFRNVHGLDSLEYFRIIDCPVVELTFEEGSSSSSSGNSVAVPLDNIWTDNMQVFKKLTGLENFGETEENNFCEIELFNNFLWISQCEDLKSLHFHKLSSLISLKIENCPQLQSLLLDFHKFSSLEELKIKSCPQLQSLPADFYKLLSLNSLHIEDCPQLQSLHADFYKLSSLNSLHIEDCPQLQSLPAYFYKLSSLKLLSIKDCQQLPSLPPDFHKLSSLEKLYIYDCPQLQSLPPSFGKLSSLQFLYIYSCEQHQTLPPDFHMLSSLEKLYIYDCPQLQSLPPSFGNLSSLRFLYIYSCEQLQSLPPDFYKLSSLQKLDIEDCPQLQSLPPDFHKLSSLNSLDIEDCLQLQSLPSDFHKLSSLEILNIKYCPQLQSLPPDFHKLSSLKSLYIQDCLQLQSLPPDFHKLSSLEILNIKSCPQLQSLPPDFHKLSSLNSLDIQDCLQLQSLLPDFHNLSSLEILNIKYCPQLQSLKLSINSLVIAYQQPIEERCKLESGHVWNQIKHIRDITLSAGEHNYIQIRDGILVDYSEEDEEEEEEEKEAQEMRNKMIM